MSNVVSITVTARDATRDAFDSVARSARRIGDSMRAVFSRIGDGFRDLGHGGRSFFSRIGEGFKKVWDAAGSVGEKMVALGQKMGEFADSPQAKLLLLAAAITALPLIASTAAVAITLGLGGAIAGIGIMAAAQNDKVKKAFSDLKESVTDDLAKMAEPFVPVLTGLAKTFGDTFDKLSPALTRAFERMAPMIESFGEKLAKGVEAFGPTIDVIAAKFGPLLDVFGSELQVMLQHLANGFVVLADAADPEFLSLLMSTLTVFLDMVVYTIAVLAQLGSAITNVVDLIPGIDLDDGSASARSFGEAVSSITEKTLSAGSGIAGLTTKTAELANQFLAASGSEIAFEQAIDRATAAAKRNGRTLDLNTEKGRENRQALNSIASSALQMRDKMEKAGQDSSKAMSRARTQFINAAVAMGMSRSEARKLADQSGLLAQKINSVPSKKHTQFSSNANSVRGDVANLSATLGSVARNIAINIAANVSANRKATGGIVGQAATGGVRNGFTLVGEAGPELVRLPVGSTVYSKGDSDRMMSSGSGRGGGDKTINSGVATGLQALRALTDVLDGKISTIKSKMNAALSAVKKQLDGSAEDRMTAWAKKQIDQMEKLAKERDKWSKKLEEARNYAKDVARSMADSASLRALGPSTGVGIQVGLQSKLAQMRAFAKALKDLAKRGLSKVLLRQITEEGVEGGLQLAQEFLAMDKATFASVNKTQSEIDKVANSIGTTAADQQYGLKAMEKQEAKWQDRMEKLADKFADKIAKALRRGGRKAAGGPAGGWNLVGEEGPELVRLPYGSSVLPASNTRRALAGSSADDAVRLEWVGGNAGDEFMRWLRANIRATAGRGPDSVQIALGG